MAVFRVEKTKDYTTMSNYHLRDKNLSLKAKGLLSLCLSLPDSWDYSIRGISAICKEGKDSITTVLQELERNGYLERHQLRQDNGKMGSIEYVIYELPHSPCTKKPCTGKPDTVKPDAANPDTEEPDPENPPQINTNKSNTEIINNGNKEREKNKEKETRHKYGEYQNVLLSDDEMKRLKEDYPQDYLQWIERLSEYIASTGKSYKSHLATIRCWARREQKQPPASRRAAYSHDKYNCKDGDSL